MFSAKIQEKFEIHEWRNAIAVLENAHPSEWKDLIAVLTKFELKRSHLVVPGGQKSMVSESLDSKFYKHGWVERQFDTKITVDKIEFSSPTHSVDCYKNGVALEIEWNNKDPFFDRDLNNFRLLFDLRVVEVGIIITRCDELQSLFAELGRGHSFGQSTTHMSKLLPRLEGGGGGGCPVLVFGIKKNAYVED